MGVKNTTAGFSLVEVNLAILLVTIGLLTLFSLFPLGLRESDMAVVDTQEAMFADHVLNGMKANAQDIVDWSVWTNQVRFVREVQLGVYPIDHTSGRSNNWSRLTTPVDFPPTDPGDANAVARQVRYRLFIENTYWNKTRKRVVLEVKSGKYGGFSFPQVYSTELIFSGM